VDAGSGVACADHAAFFLRSEMKVSAPAATPYSIHLKGRTSAISLRIGRTATVPGADW